MIELRKYQRFKLSIITIWTISGFENK